MKRYEYILFDLDGTLTDPGIGITNSVMYSLNKYGITVNDRAELYKFIGPPLEESFKEYYRFSKDESKKALEYYREYFKSKGIYENIVYDGVGELLKNLKKSEKTLIVATSKPELFAKQILDHFKLSHYFTYIAGATMDGTRTKKNDVIAYALDSCNISDKSSVIMIGDREHDIIGAKKVGIDSIGVLYGYGSRNELEAAGATYIAEKIYNLKSILDI